VAARRAGVKTVAERAGVSVGTVSNVLNRPESVAEETRLRVEAAMAELNFVRNASARQLRAGQSTVVGAIVLDLRNPFYTALARGIEDLSPRRHDLGADPVPADCCYSVLHVFTSSRFFA